MLPEDPDRTGSRPGPVACAAGCSRPAERGLLCAACHGRLARALRQLPDTILDRHAGCARRAYDVYDALAGWVRDALEVYPPPTARPPRLDAVVGPSAHGPLTPRHRPLGVPDDAHGLADAARALCGWLDRHLPWVESQPWAARMAAELGSLVEP
ncbi:hypothetical protein [Luteimicrobium sp. DT211]|uniref:hypothetical protein n=1 Tax=Luteimicrobium sp. DT211 TaxID=3393412 RepID=UPI003CF5541F